MALTPLRGFVPAGANSAISLVPEHVGQEHWAHTGLLNTAEYYQILAEKERLWASLSGTTSIGVVPQPEDNSIFG